MGGEAARLGDFLHAVERGRKLVIVSLANTVEALGATADDQMRGAELGGAIRRAGHPGQFLRQNVVEDEVAAGIGRHERQPVVAEQGPHVFHAKIKKVPVEELDALITRRRDVREGPAHVAKGAVGEIGD